MCWLEIQLLRTLHQIDLSDGSLIAFHKNEFSTPKFGSPNSSFSSPDSGVVSFTTLASTSASTSNRLFLSDLIIEPNILLNDTQILAESFQSLKMDNEQLAILSAILIFEPEFMPKVCFIFNLYKILLKIIYKN